MKKPSIETVDKILDFINEIEQVTDTLYVALEWPEYQDYQGDNNVAFDEEGNFLLIPAKQYLNKKYKNGK